MSSSNKNNENENRLIKGFMKALIDYPEKRKFLIDREIHEVKKVIYNTNPIRSFSQALHPMQPSVDTPAIFNFLLYEDRFFYKTLNEYLENDDFDFETIPDDKIKTAKDAILLADYFNWLNTLEVEKIEKKKVEDFLSHKQKVLALYYLGINNFLGNQTQFGIALSKILGLNDRNTWKYLSYVRGKANIVKTEENLKKLLILFENEIFEEIREKIKDDLKTVTLENKKK